MNILLSHPSTAMPSGELQKVIAGQTRTDNAFDTLRKIITYQLPLSLALGKRYFLPANTSSRPVPSETIQKYIDWMLYREKIRARRTPGHNLFISENQTYTCRQLQSARLVCKNISGLVYLTEPLQHIYEDASFVCVIRDGLALLESHTRRGKDGQKFAETYHRIVSEMLRCKNTYENYQIVRYEDIVAAPRECMASIYRFVDLDLSAVEKVRFQLKSTVQEDGSSKSYGEEDRTLRWYELDDMDQHLHGGVNRNQIANLSREDKDRFLKKNAKLMETLGYAT